MMFRMRYQTFQIPFAYDVQLGYVPGLILVEIADVQLEMAAADVGEKLPIHWFRVAPFHLLSGIRGVPPSDAAHFARPTRSRKGDLHECARRPPTRGRQACAGQC